VAVAALVLAAVVIWLSGSKQPSHNGRELADWVRDLDQRNLAHSQAQHAAAVTAISEIGTNAIPYLLREMGATDSKAEENIRDWAQNLRPHFDIDPYVSAVDRQFTAFLAFSVLGERAVDALPELDRMVLRSGSGLAISAMGTLGPDAAPRLIDHLRWETNGVAAAQALGNVGPAAKDAIPLLIERLQSPDRFVWISASRALFLIGPNRPEVVDALVSDLESRGPKPRSNYPSARNVAGMIDLSVCCVPELRHRMPVEERKRHDRLMQALEAILEVAALRNPEMPERRKLVEGLLTAPRVCFALLPALLEAARDDDSFVRDASVFLLHSRFFGSPDMRWGSSYGEGHELKQITMAVLHEWSSDPDDAAVAAGLHSFLRAVYCDRSGVRSRLTSRMGGKRPRGVSGNFSVRDRFGAAMSQEAREFLAFHAGRSKPEDQAEVAQILAESMMDKARFVVGQDNMTRDEIELLERGMKSEDVRVRRICAKGLGLPANDPSLKGIRQAYNSKLLIEALKNDPDPEVRRLAADGLRMSFWGAETSAELIEALTAGLSDNDATVRGSSAVSMGMARREARAWLHRRPNRPRPSAAYIAADESPIVERLVELLEDENPVTAQRAAWALIFFDGGSVEAYGKRLVELLDHKAESARVRALMALGNLKMDESLTAVVVPRLVDLMDVDSDKMRSAVEEALARYMSWELAYACNTPHWTEQLDSQDPDARIKAMVRLAFDAQRSEGASERIWELFREGRAREKKWALIALQRIDPEGYADAAAEGIRFAAPD